MCGKIIVATSEDELSTLDLLHERGKENGIKGIKKLSSNELREYEPHATGLFALHCPETGIIDYQQVCEKLSENIQKRGEIITDVDIVSIDDRSDGITIATETIEYNTALINCAGLFSDQSGLTCRYRAQGAYRSISWGILHAQGAGRHLVKNLIYPVPDPNYPFLGVHFTRTIDGGIEAGPNAVLAWAREGYKKTDIDLKEMWDYLSYGGFWRMAGKYWTTAMGEYYRSFFKGAFVNALQKLVPEITADDILQGTAGVRAQAHHRMAALWMIL